MEWPGCFDEGNRGRREVGWCPDRRRHARKRPVMFRKTGHSGMAHEAGAYTYFTEELVMKAKFESPRAAFRHMQVEAMREGFEIGATQSLDSVYNTFYCLKGGKQKGKQTTKTGCGWCLKIGPMRGDGDGNPIITVKSVNFEHNHPCHPDMYSVFTCPADVQDLIVKMRECDISPRKVVDVLAKLGHHGVTARQVRRVTEGGQKECLHGAESLDLEEYVNANGGFFAALRRTSDGISYTQAVLTLMPFEQENIRRFGSVMFLDGTHNNSSMKWEMIPITLVDQYRRIRSGGVAFMASTDEETLSWLLKTLHDIPPVRDTTQTVISDEDSAFIPALSSVVTETDWHINHVLCAFHKEKNFIQKIMKCGFTDVERGIAKDLFKVVCYSTHKDSVDQALEKLKAMHPNLSTYLEKKVVPTLCQFSRAYLGEVWTKGYNTTSPAEAHNAMYKARMPNRATTLKQMRIDYTHAHLEAERSFQESIARSFQNDHFTFTQGGIMLSPKIRRDISVINARAEKLVCTPVNGEGRFKVFAADSPDIYHVATLGSCDCGKPTNEGLPCEHIIRVTLELHGKDSHHWPYALVHRDWIITHPMDVHGGMNEDGHVEEVMEPDESVHEKEMLVDGDGDVTNNRQDALEGLNVSLLTSNIPVYTQRKKRYLTLYHLAKSCASLACRDVEHSQRLLTELTNIKSHLLEIPDEVVFSKEFRNEEEEEEEESQEQEHPESDTSESDEHMEIRDAGGRPRGRKKQSFLDTYRQGRAACFLCGGRHQYTDCRNFTDFRAAVEHNQRQPDDPRRRRCKYCSGIGHNGKTCQWLYQNKKKNKD